jgi:hypothetical protein
VFISELIDIKSFLSHYGVPYNTSGKNISGSGAWIGLSCPFCNDSGNHLGIHTQSKVVNCWKCGAKGKSLVRFVALTLNCSLKEAIDRLLPFQSEGGASTLPRTQSKPINSKLDLPEEATDLDQSHKNYLISRNYDPDELIKQYQIKGTGFLGNWAFRIIIPFFVNNRLVTYSSRDITNKSQERYKACPATKEIINIKDLLYNRQNAGSVGVAVEGIFDAWRIGNGAFAISGIDYTPSQLIQLKGISRLFVMFDNEDRAQIQAEQFCHDAGVYVPEVINIQIEYKDPDSIPNSEIPSLRQQLFNKIY